jgi:hypothetical protein
MTLMIVFNSWFLLLVFRFGSVSFLLERDCTKLGSVIEQLWAFFVGCFFFLQDTTLTEHFEMDLVRGLYEFHLSYKVSKMAEVQFSVERVKKLETFALDPGGT